MTDWQLVVSLALTIVGLLAVVWAVAPIAQKLRRKEDHDHA